MLMCLCTFGSGYETRGVGNFGRNVGGGEGVSDDGV